MSSECHNLLINVIVRIYLFHTTCNMNKVSKSESIAIFCKYQFLFQLCLHISLILLRYLVLTRCHFMFHLVLNSYIIDTHSIIMYYSKIYIYILYLGSGLLHFFSLIMIVVTELIPSM